MWGESGDAGRCVGTRPAFCYRLGRSAKQVPKGDRGKGPVPTRQDFGLRPVT